MRDDKELQNIRPDVITEKVVFNELEEFQNEVLRPILKYQHSLFELFISNSKEVSILLNKGLPLETRRAGLKQIISKQPHLKYLFIGQVCGLFTNLEYKYYLENKQDLDKRLIAMIIDRILSI